MKFTINVKSFAEALSWVNKTLDSRRHDNNNRQQYMALSLNDNKPYLFFVGPTSYMRAEFDVEGEIDGNGVFVLDEQYLSHLGPVLSKVKGTAVVRGNSSSMSIDTGSGRYTIPLLELDPPSEPEIVTLGEVPDREFFTSMKNLSKLCDRSSTGTVFECVDVTLNDDTALLMGTDRFALSEIGVDFDQQSDVLNGETLLIPFSRASMVSASRGLDSSVDLVYEPTTKKFGYRFDDGRVALFSLINAEPINYVAVKNKRDTMTNSLVVETAAFKDALSTVSSLTWDDKYVFLDITEDGLEVRDESGANRKSVVIEPENVTEFSAKFSKVIIDEAFYPITTAFVRLQWSESNTFVFTPVTEDREPMDNAFVLFMGAK